MLSKSQKKAVQSLGLKKNRQAQELFIVEGVKMVEELLNSSYAVEKIFAVDEWKANNSTVDAISVTEKELASISSLKTPNEVLAVVRQQYNVYRNKDLTIVLDGIQDPGNMGTIIRTADWFGIENIVCSSNCVDVYNPKVVQATMGSLFRVNIFYKALDAFFEEHREHHVYGATLTGKSIYEQPLSAEKAILVLGNESKGISREIIPFITQSIKIPRYGSAESLNVAVAAAVISSEFRRN